MLDRLQYFALEPRVVLELGSVPGVAEDALRRRYPRALRIVVDAQADLLREARRRQRFWRRHPLLHADARSLPFADGSVDLVLGSLPDASGESLRATGAGIRRVLRPGGLLLASCIDARADITTLASALAAAGMVEPVVDRETRAGAGPGTGPNAGSIAGPNAGAGVEVLYVAAFAGVAPRTRSLPDGSTLATIGIDSIGRRQS